MHEQVLMPGGSPVRVKWNEYPHFTYPWHFHSEIELVFVLKSYGVRFVADSLEKFNEGDLVLVGSQVPHYWKNDEAFHQGNPQLKEEAVVVQLSPDFLDRSLEVYPELAAIRDLFRRAQQGISFSQGFAQGVKDQIVSLVSLQGFERFLEVLKLLGAMARTKDYRLLASRDFRKNPLDVNDQRLEKILNYLNLNYTEKISLVQLAGQFGMNPSAFSRYFSEKTGKSLVHYINELRVKYACKLFRNKAESVSQVCFECGFNNISNFNRFFRSVMKMTPSEYMQQFR